MPSVWEGTRDQEPHVDQRFMTEKDEEEMRKEPMFTQTTLLLQKK